VGSDASPNHPPDHRVQSRAITPAGEDPEAHGATLPNGFRTPAGYDASVLAINGFLEWFFLGLLSFLVVAVTVFGVFMGIQLFRSPGRSPRPRG
jgi:hypothetical protein